MMPIGLYASTSANGNRAGKHDGKNVQLANTPRNELRILRAEIKNNDGLGVHLPVWQDPRRTVKNSSVAVHEFRNPADVSSIDSGTNNSSTKTLPTRYATRQPILAADETVIGYKLLFRTDVVSHFSAADTTESARTTIDMSTLLGLDILLR